MKKFLIWGLAIALAVVVAGHQDGIAAKGKKPKPKAVSKTEAEFELLGTVSPEDYEDQDDFEELKDISDLFLRTYKTYKVNGKDELVLTSKKKIQVIEDDQLTLDGVQHLAVFGQEQFGVVEILDKPHGKKVEPYRKDLAKIKHEGKTYALWAEDDKNAPARCYAAGTRLLTPPYKVYTWEDCVYWAQNTRPIRCREIEMTPGGNRSTDYCKCFY